MVFTNCSLFKSIDQQLCVALALYMIVVWQLCMGQILAHVIIIFTRFVMLKSNSNWNE